MSNTSSSFSAAEQALGYIFQFRFALLKVLELPEDAVVQIERNDDVEFITNDRGTTLGSMKHKATGDRLTDLSLDFWKSVRIWATHYKSSGKNVSSDRYILFSTSSISQDSFLNLFTAVGGDDAARVAAALDAMNRSGSKEIKKIKSELDELTAEEALDFYSRILIFPQTSRITEIPALIDQRLRTIRREHRQGLFERLEGWWVDLVIKRLSGGRNDGIRVQDISDKLAALADEYRSDNLPINFRQAAPR